MTTYTAWYLTIASLLHGQVTNIFICQIIVVWDYEYDSVLILKIFPKCNKTITTQCHSKCNTKNAHVLLMLVLNSENCETIWDGPIS